MLGLWCRPPYLLREGTSPSTLQLFSLTLHISTLLCKNNRGYCANCHKAQGATGQAYAADTESPTYSPRFPKQKRVKPPPEPRYGEAEANELAELWGLQKEIAEFEWPKVSSSIPSFPPPQHHITNRLVFFAIEFCPSGQERLFGC